MWVRVIVGDGNEVISEAYRSADILTKTEMSEAVAEVSASVNEKNTTEIAELESQIAELQTEVNKIKAEKL